MVQAVIFDLYGVLAVNGWQAFKERHFHDREDVWDKVHRLGRQVDAGLNDYAELVRFTSEVTGESETEVRYQLEHTIANTELLNFIQDELYGSYKLGILSNASNAEVVDHIFTPEQRRLFDVVSLSRQAGMAKPDVRAYEAIAVQLDLQPEDCVFIDDKEHHVTGARDAGMSSILFQDFAQFRVALEKLLTNS